MYMYMYMHMYMYMYMCVCFFLSLSLSRSLSPCIYVYIYIYTVCMCVCMYVHPVSNCLAKLAAELLRPSVQALAARFPQYAFISQRSVEDSIERACSHCAAVRTTIEAQKYNIHLRRAGCKAGKCKGGLTLSLDLSRAFDCLPREVLHSALVFAEVHPQLIDLILHIHRHSTLRISHKSHDIDVELHSGVRQGCSLSPALWSIFICYVLHLLSAQIPAHSPDCAFR